MNVSQIFMTHLFFLDLFHLLRELAGPSASEGPQVFTSKSLISAEQVVCSGLWDLVFSPLKTEKEEMRIIEVSGQTAKNLTAGLC